MALGGMARGQRPAAPRCLEGRARMVDRTYTQADTNTCMDPSHKCRDVKAGSCVNHKHSAPLNIHVHAHTVWSSVLTKAHIP